MRILVCGGRDYDNYQLLSEVLNDFAPHAPLMIIHGDARGADALAGMWARANVKQAVQEVKCPASWDALGNGAGPVRNAMMLELQPDVVIAFPGGRGTADMVKRAKKAKIQVIEL